MAYPYTSGADNVPMSFKLTLDEKERPAHIDLFVGDVTYKIQLDPKAHDARGGATRTCYLYEPLKSVDEEWISEGFDYSPEPL